MHKALLIESKDGGTMDKMKVGIVAVAAICAGAAFAKDFDPRAFGAKGVRFDGCTFEEE